MKTVKSLNCVNMQNDKDLTETNCVVESALFLGSVIEWTDRVVTGSE